jgi:oligopeptide transport system substrate-binding protein
MHQVPEITRIALPERKRRIERRRHIPQRSILIVVLWALIACGHHNESNNATKSSSGPGIDNEARVLRRGLPGEPRTLDPQLADDDFSFQIVRDIYEGLTAEDSYGQIVPGAASTWTVDDSGTVYTFSLRPDAKWSNGDRILASEFVEGMRRAVDPKTASGSAGLLSVIRGASEIIAGRKNASDLAVTSVGDATVRIQLEHPAPFVLQILSQPIASPIHNSSKSSSETVYSGAYVLEARVPGSSIDLVRNPNYWNSSKVSIQRVRYVNAESQATELREYAAGQLDMTFTIPMSDLSRVLQKFGSEVQMAPTLGTVYLALNLLNGPLKSSVELRQALAMAVDKEQIAEHLMMGATPAYTFVANGTSNYDPPKYEWASWSREDQLAQARTLYKRSGYSEKNPLHLKLYYNNSEGIQQIMIAVASSWKQNLGVVSELTGDEFRVFLEGRKDHSRWDVARLGWEADYDDPSSFLEIFSTGDSQNDPAYSSTRFNDLLGRARVEPHPDRRGMLFREAEQVLLNDYPIIPIYFSRGRRLVKPYVGGAHMTPMRRTYTKNLFWQSAGQH